MTCGDGGDLLASNRILKIRFLTKLEPDKKLKTRVFSRLEESAVQHTILALPGSLNKIIYLVGNGTEKGCNQKA